MTIPASVVSGKKICREFANGKFCGDRNVHHLTPKSRKGEPFFGNYRCNMLLIRVERHDALHSQFGTRTWEEIIVILSRCATAEQKQSFAMLVERIQSARGLCKKESRRIVRQALRSMCYATSSGIFPELFLI